MRYRTLGATRLTVSVLGFGAATLGDEYGAIDPGAARRAVEAAVDEGINFFDVSPYYGRTVAEARLGEYLQGRRDRVVLATKVGRYDRDPPHGFDFSAERVTRSVEESLRRLRTDVIDLYLAHDVEFGRRETILNETLPTMRRLQEQGKVRYIGVSGYPLGFLREVAVAGAVDAVLSYCHCNLLNTALVRELAPLAHERRIGLVNASPLHMGVLTDEGPPPWHPAPEPVLRAAREAAAWCRERGESIADVALRFALHGEAAASTLVGMRREEEVRAGLRALETPPDPEVVRGVRAVLAPALDVEWMVGLPENNDPGVAAPGPG